MLLGFIFSPTSFVFLHTLHVVSPCSNALVCNALVSIIQISTQSFIPNESCFSMSLIRQNISFNEAQESIKTTYLTALFLASDGLRLALTQQRRKSKIIDAIGDELEALAFHLSLMCHHGRMNLVKPVPLTGIGAFPSGTWNQVSITNVKCFSTQTLVPSYPSFMSVGLLPLCQVFVQNRHSGSHPSGCCTLFAF